MPQFVAADCVYNELSHQKIDIGKSPRDVKNTDFLSILYNEPLLRYRELKFKVGNRVGISKNDIPFRKGYKPQLTDEFLKFRQNLQKIPPHTSSKFWENFMKKSLKNVLIKGKSFFKPNFYRSVVMDSFTVELVSNASFNCYPNNSLSSFTNFLPEQIHLKGE